MTRVRARCGRRRARGAALVEAVAVLPLFVVVLAALLHLTALYLEKTRVLRDARRAAWTHALAGCRGPSGTARTRPDGTAAGLLERHGRTLESSTAGLAAAAGGEAAGGQLASAEATAEGHVSGLTLLGLLRADLSVQMRLPCNERPRPGSVSGALGYGWDAVRFW